MPGIAFILPIHCQYRGHELLEGRRKLGKGITCPYHAWFYNHEGDLISARHTEQLAGFDASEYPLRQLPIAFSAGLIFVNFNPDCDPFDSEMEGFGPSIAKQIPEIENFAAVHKLHYSIDANWKVWWTIFPKPVMFRWPIPSWPKYSMMTWTNSRKILKLSNQSNATWPARATIKDAMSAIRGNPGSLKTYCMASTCRYSKRLSKADCPRPEWAAVR